MKWLRMKWRAVRWAWFWKWCNVFDVYPIPRQRLARADVILSDMYQFLEHSGFLRDGRYPGGRHAERSLRTLFEELGEQFDFLHDRENVSFDFARDDSLLTERSAPTTFH